MNKFLSAITGIVTSSTVSDLIEATDLWRNKTLLLAGLGLGSVVALGVVHKTNLVKSQNAKDIATAIFTPTAVIYSLYAVPAGLVFLGLHNELSKR